MSHPNFDPPKQALWVLKYLCLGDNDALTGDLIERFREGQTPGWFWKQTLVACAVSIPRAVWRHSPEFGYAAAATAFQAVVWFHAPSLLWTIAAPAPSILHWYALPWPWSQIAMELSPAFVLAIAALSILAGALILRGTFRWSSLLRTGILSVVLLTVHHYLSDFLSPWISRPSPVPGDPYARVLIFPLELEALAILAIFFVSARLGCRSGALHLHEPDAPVGSA